MKKKTILITSRIDKANNSNSLWNVVELDLYNFFNKLKYELIFISPFEKKINVSKIKKIDGVILSGGNDLGEFLIRDNFEKKIIKFCIKKNISLLGICRGMQLINIFFGGKIKKVNNHVGIKHNIYSPKYKLIRKVNSYHNWGIKKNNIGKNLIISSISKDNYVESFSHDKYRIFGIMWHPEREKRIKSDDKKLIKKIF